MITAFGEYVRSLRRRHSELLKEMAEHLQVTSAFLSAVESGKKGVPPDWKARLASIYKLPKPECEALQRAIDESQRSVTIDLDGQSGVRRGVAVALARSFNELTDEQLMELRQNMFLLKPKGDK